MIERVIINRFKVKRIELLKTAKNSDIVKYKLYTEKKRVILNISKKDFEKITILKYIKCPFFILSYANIDNEIKIGNSFEISSDDLTLNLECETSCGLNQK